MRAFDDDPVCDHDQYFWFTGKSRISRDMHILHGYIQGIAADSRINDLEIKGLISWLSARKEFADRHPFNEVIPRIQQIVSQTIVDEEQRADLLWLSNKFATDDGYYDDVTSEMQRLQGILAGVLSDGRIYASELKALMAWVDERAYLKRCWPYDELHSIIRHVLRDGRLDAQEHEALLQFFGEFVSAKERKAIGIIEREVTVSGVCAMNPEIVFEACGFCFTGASKRGTRDSLVQVVIQKGGTFHRNLRKDTDFLIVGEEGNPCWAFACYGRKVEDAVERRRNGQRLLIVQEDDFWVAAEKKN